MQEKQDTDKTVSSEVYKFLSDTTAHGFSQISSKSNAVRRAAYTLVVLTSLGFLLYNFINNMVKYAEYDSYLNTEVRVRKQVTLPSVTICSYAYHTRSAFEARYPNISSNDFALTFSYPLMFGADPPETPAPLTGIEEYNTAPFSGLYTDLRPSIDDVFVRCSVLNKPVDCNQLVSTYLTDYSICHVAHSNDYASKHGAINTSLSSQTGGFRFILDANPDDYLLNPQLGAGFLVMIHDVDEYPQTDGHSLHIGVGQSVNIAFRKQI